MYFPGSLKSAEECFRVYFYACWVEFQSLGTTVEQAFADVMLMDLMEMYSEVSLLESEGFQSWLPQGVLCSLLNLRSTPKMEEW